MRLSSGGFAPSTGCYRLDSCRLLIKAPMSPRRAAKSAAKSKVLRRSQRAPGAALGDLRTQIDADDEQLHALLNQRARLAQQAGISKHSDGHTVDFYRPEREAEVLRRALERNPGPRGHFYAGGGAQAFRPFGPGAGAADRR